MNVLPRSNERERGLFRGIPRTPTGHPRATKRHHEIPLYSPLNCCAPFRGTAKRDETLERERERERNTSSSPAGSWSSTGKTDYSCPACACDSPLLSTLSFSRSDALIQRFSSFFLSFLLSPFLTPSFQSSFLLFLLSLSPLSFSSHHQRSDQIFVSTF